MRALIKRLGWVITGTARNGECPRCLNPTATVYPDRWECEHCDAGGSLPEAPKW